jgi:hypothetical protein
MMCNNNIDWSPQAIEMLEKLAVNKESSCYGVSCGSCPLAARDAELKLGAQDTCLVSSFGATRLGFSGSRSEDHREFLSRLSQALLDVYNKEGGNG